MHSEPRPSDCATNASCTVSIDKEATKQLPHPPLTEHSDIRWSMRTRKDTESKSQKPTQDAISPKRELDCLEEAR